MKLCLNILAILSILMVVCLILVLLISYFENRKLVLTKYQIKDSGLPKAFNGFKILHLSDMHNARFGDENEPLFRIIEEAEPDIILITGDMFVGKPAEDVIYAAEVMNSLCKFAPVYFSMGNHELRVSLYKDTYKGMWDSFIEHVSPEVHLLFDKTEIIKKDGECLYIHGLNLTPELYRRFIKTPMPKDYLDSLFGICETGEYHILMAHNPDYFEDYARWGANLTLSGHVHGGMIRLPFAGGALSPMIHFFPKYDKGLFKYSNKNMILSGGLGNHTFKFRVNNLPEVVFITLYQETK